MPRYPQPQCFLRSREKRSQGLFTTSFLVRRCPPCGFAVPVTWGDRERRRETLVRDDMLRLFRWLYKEDFAKRGCFSWPGRSIMTDFTSRTGGLQLRMSTRHTWYMGEMSLTRRSESQPRKVSRFLVSSRCTGCLSLSASQV